MEGGGRGDCLLFSEQRSGALVDMFFSTTRVFELDSKKKMFQIITLKQKETTIQKRFKKKKKPKLKQFGSLT